MRQLCRQVTWYHDLAILEKLSSPEDRIWYAKATMQHGWSRNIPVLQIETGRKNRQGHVTSNFDPARLAELYPSRPA
jgi:predicted nuclease of restriction endonuclease-like (RecB) superfamily